MERARNLEHIRIPLETGDTVSGEVLDARRYHVLMLEHAPVDGP